MDQLCTSDLVKTFAPVGGNFTGHDTKIAALIGMATEVIQTHCRRTFIQRAYVEYFPSRDTCNTGREYTIWLKEAPLSAAPTIKVDYSRNWVNATPLAYAGDQPTDDFAVNLENGRVDIFFGLSKHPRSIQVSYTGGYAQDVSGLIDAPDAVAKATALQASFWLKRELEMSSGRAQDERKKGGTPIKLSADAVKNIIPEAQLLLRDYRRPLVGKF